MRTCPILPCRIRTRATWPLWHVLDPAGARLVFDELAGRVSPEELDQAIGRIEDGERVELAGGIELAVSLGADELVDAGDARPRPAELRRG